MKTHKITKMSGKGDELVAEWNETTSPEKIAEIEAEFNELMKSGYTPADLETNELVDKWRPNTDFIMIPRMAGGAE